VGKRTGFNVIESAQQRALSDFTFDLEASLLTTDTLKRRTYTVPFLEKGDKYSTFNLVMVADSVDNILDQYVLQYEFDSIQYQKFEETKDFLIGGVTIKRFPFSSFFNDSNPDFLERHNEIFDSNGDPVTCDQVTISGTSSGGGGGQGGSGSLWTTPGGSGGSPLTGAGGGACSWTVSLSPCSCQNHTTACGCNDTTRHSVITISCNPANRRITANQAESMMSSMDCNVSDFGSPVFTLTRDATVIANLLGGNLLTDWHLQYLSNNPSLSSELRDALRGDPSIDTDAALFTILAGMNGAYTGNFNSNFGLAIEGLMTDSEADFTNDYIIRLFQTYFEVRYAALKSINPSWSNGKLFYETSKEAIHLALDGIGLIEGLGTPADLLNAGMYYIEGDRLNGNLSLVAATPVIGFFSTTVKGALRLKGIIPGTSIRITQTWTKNGDQIIFGGTRLREAMGLIDPTKHAHHILPLELVDHAVVQKAANFQANPFHKNEIFNGLEVLAAQNTTHPAYNTFFRTKLDNFLRRNPNASPEAANDFIGQEVSKAKAAIQNLPANGKLNDVIWD